MIINRIIRGILKYTNNVYYKIRFSNVGHNTIITKPLKIKGCVKIGHHCNIQYKSWIEANPLTGEDKAEITIGNHCAIGHFNEIYATKSIIIEDNVLTADRVYITDNLHGYENPDLPVKNQPIKQLNPVRIGEGSWLGIGVAVIGANIGKHCIIGANAVITKDIPDYSVAVGIPAKVIKRFNLESNRWKKTDSSGTFNN